MSSSLKAGLCFNKRWTIGKKLGEGANAEVFEVVGTSYVIKICPLPVGKAKTQKMKDATIRVNSIYFENTLYNGVLLGFSRAPFRPIGNYGEDHGHRYLVLERLEYDLMTLAEASPVSISEIARIGFEMLKGFEELHAKNYTFVDVKPDNFMIKDNKLYFVDYGLIDKFIDISTGRHRVLNTSSVLQGTPTFSSLARHSGCNHSRRDDIEAMGYVLLSLRSGGKLPWSTATSESNLHDLKKNCDIIELSRECECAEIGEIIMACRNLEFEEVPNYAAYAKLLEQMRTSKGTSGGGGSLIKGGGSKKAYIASSPSSSKSLAAKTNARGKTSKEQPLRRTVTKPIEDTLIVISDEEDENSPPMTRKRMSLESASGNSPSPIKTQKSSSRKLQPQSTTTKVLSLCVFEGPDKGAEFDLDFKSSTSTKVKIVGRGDEADLRLEVDEYVSEEHAFVRLGSMNNTIEVKDCGSTNGIKINKIKIQATKKWFQVNVDDTLQMGKNKLQLKTITR